MLGGSKGIDAGCIDIASGGIHEWWNCGIIGGIPCGLIGGMLGIVMEPSGIIGGIPGGLMSGGIVGGAPKPELLAAGSVLGAPKLLLAGMLLPSQPPADFALAPGLSCLSYARENKKEDAFLIGYTRINNYLNRG